MGWLLIVSIAAMTSVMTMVQLIALTLTTQISPAPQAKAGSEKTGSVSISSTKKNGKVVSRRSAKHRTRRNGPRTAHIFKASHQK